MTKKIIIATTVTVLYLIFVNGFIFPFIFPDGLVETFSNARQTQLFQYHLIALVVTAFFFSFFYPLVYKGRTPWKAGLKYGTLLGLFVALPEHLHLYAMIESSFVRQFIPVLWIFITWGLAGIIISFIFGRITTVSYQTKN